MSSLRQLIKVFPPTSPESQAYQRGASHFRQVDEAVDQRNIPDDFSTSSYELERADCDSKELVFEDNGCADDLDGIEGWGDDTSSATLPKRVLEIAQIYQNTSASSSMEHINLKRSTSEEKTVQASSKTQEPDKKSFVGIPPLHHHKDLTTTHVTSTHAVPRFMMATACSTDYWRWRASYERESDQSAAQRQSWSWAPTKTRVIQNQKAWKEMPSHLVPFVPYIEKSAEDKKASVMTRPRNMTTAVIKQWLSTCKKLHRNRCYGNDDPHTVKKAHSRPMYLIDVKTFCLVPASMGMQYVALSYVWGRSDTTACTNTLNIQDLLEEEGLRRSAIGIPRTVLDAMTLIENLGERYLWVDRFCIIQNDLTGKQSQLTAMGEIYAGAYFTLIAAQTEDASRSLYGERTMIPTFEVSVRQSPGNCKQPPVSNKEIMLDQSVRLMRTKWFSRGWTFQEYQFSTRRVVFHNDTVNWECLCASWHEAQDMPALIQELQVEQNDPSSSSKVVRGPLTGFGVSPWPDLHRYARLVALFNERDLTYPEDILDAFAGCLHGMSSAYPGGFLSGIPIMCFDAALLWQPWVPATRRESKRPDNSKAVLPSWSWAGWSGVLQSESWRSASNYQIMTYEGHPMSEQCSWKTISIVEWFYSESLTSERYPVNIAPECARPNFSHQRNDLPIGWSCTAKADDPNVKLYYHECDPSQPFRYPLPICHPEGPPQPVINVRYLHCTTYRAYLKAGEAFPSWSSNCPAVDLVTISGEWAGFLRLNCAPSDVEALLEDQKHNHQGLCELIEISSGSVEDLEIEERSFDEWNRPHCPRKEGLYEFVNVLWIEHNNNVAYRKALGRVQKSIWIDIKKDMIAITLG